MKKISIFDISIDLLTCRQLIDRIVSGASESEKIIIGNVNAKALNLAYENPAFKRFLRQCHSIYTDGYGPLMGAKLLGYPVNKNHRNTCPDFIDSLLETIIQNEKKIFFLCGTGEVIKRLEAKLARRHPHLQFKAHYGFFDKNGRENEEIIEKINAFQPDILYVGFGMPLQEYWILDNMEAIDAHVFLPEGACLDFYTNTAYRAPRFLTDRGLEWLARLVSEPQRLWRRYLIGNPTFLYRLMKYKWQKKFKNE